MRNKNRGRRSLREARGRHEWESVSYKLTKDEYDYLHHVIPNEYYTVWDVDTAEYFFIGDFDELGDMLNSLKGLYDYHDEIDSTVIYKVSKSSSLEKFRQIVNESLQNQKYIMRNKNRGRRSLREKRQINEGNFIPKEDLEREIEKEWSKIAGEKIEIDIIGDYDIDDYAVYAFGSELATLRLFHYWTYYQPKPLDRNGYAKYTKGVSALSVAVKGRKGHYFMIWDYAN